VGQSVGHVRSVRVDALASIGRIVEAAREALRRSSSATLNRIAEDAGVGIATLYRHFPNRESLAAAVMDRVWAEDVRPLLQEFGSSNASRDDLLSVAERVVGVFEAERGVVQALRNLPALVVDHLAQDASLRDTVARAQAVGNLRPDLEPDDVPSLLAMVTTLPFILDAAPEERRRYLSLFLDGLNPARAVLLPARSAGEER